MNDDEAITLGKRIVACKGFRPMRGMLDMQGRTWDSSLLWRWHNEVDVPDLRDPATLGCLLALVREAWGDKAVIHIENNNWFYVETDGRHLWDDDNASSLLAALVAALEAAP